MTTYKRHRFPPDIIAIFGGQLIRMVKWLMFSCRPDEMELLQSAFSNGYRIFSIQEDTWCALSTIEISGLVHSNKGAGRFLDS